MVIEMIQIGTRVASTIGVAGTASKVLPTLIPESTNVAMKVCYNVAGAGIVGAILTGSNKYFDEVFADLDEIKMNRKVRPLVKEILKKESEKITEAKTEKEIAKIVEKTNEEVKAVKQRVIEEEKAKKEEKEKEKEMMRNLGIRFYRKAGKQMKAIKAEDRK